MANKLLINTFYYNDTASPCARPDGSLRAASHNRTGSFHAYLGPCAKLPHVPSAPSL